MKDLMPSKFFIFWPAVIYALTVWLCWEGLGWFSLTTVGPALLSVAVLDRGGRGGDADDYAGGFDDGGG